MGSLDRGYLRFRRKILPSKRKLNWQKRLAIVATIIAVLSAVIWLIRDTADLADDFGPAPGSLVVNINTATEAELQTIPGIGATRAAQIVVGRPYATVDELVKVVGIAEESLEGLRPFVTVEGDTRKRQQE